MNTLENFHPLPWDLWIEIRKLATPYLYSELKNSFKILELTTAVRLCLACQMPTGVVTASTETVAR